MIASATVEDDEVEVAFNSIAFIVIIDESN